MKTKLATLLETQIGFYDPKFVKLYVNDLMFNIGHRIDYTGAASSIKLTEIIEEYGDFDIEVMSIDYGNNPHELDTLSIGGWFINPFEKENIVKKFIEDYGTFGFLCISIYEYDEEAENKEKAIGKYFLNESKLPSTFDKFQIDNIIKDIFNPGFEEVYGDYEVRASHIYITPDRKNVKNSTILLQIVIEKPEDLPEEFEDDIFE